VVRTRCVKHDCKSLPESSRQSVRQISVSLITQKSPWYKLGVSSLLIRRSHVLTAPHTPRLRHLQLSPSTASQPSCTTTGHPPTVKKLLLLVVILVRVCPLESSSTTVGSVTGSTRWIGKNKKVTAVTLPLRDHRSSTTLTADHRALTIQAHYVDNRSSVLP